MPVECSLFWTLTEPLASEKSLRPLHTGMQHRYIMSASSEVTAAQKAYQSVKARILSGELPPSEMITEGEVAHQLGISRTPVREALLRLEVEGHLRLYPKRGALVVPIAPAQIHEIFDARLLVESHAAHVACGAPEASHARLLEILSVVINQQSQAIDDGELQRYAELDAQFHHHLIGAGGNTLLTEFATSIRERQQRLVAASVDRDADRARVYLEGHRTLYERLRDRDPVGYSDTLAEHLNTAKGTLL